MASPAAGKPRGSRWRDEDEVRANLCTADYELTLLTSCRGSRGFTRASNRIKEGTQCSLRPTDVATGAPCGGRKAKADRVFFGGAHGLMCARIEALMPTHGGGARATHASTRGHMWGSARTRTQELIGANRS